MIRHTSQVEINRPALQVYEYLADLDHVAEWQSGVTRSALLTPGPVRAGTRFTEAVRLLELFRLTVTCVVTEAAPGRAFGFKSTGSAAIQYEGSFTFESLGAGSRLSFNGSTTLGGLWRFLEPLFAKEVEHELAGELAHIKAIMERQAGETRVEATA
jgi:uncharacterized membrane protein